MPERDEMSSNASTPPPSAVAGRVQANVCVGPTVN